MEFLIGAFCGGVFVTFIITTWIRPKNTLKYLTKCDELGCDFIHSGNDYHDVKFICDAHREWHRERADG